MSDRSMKDKEKAKHIPAKNHKGIQSISTHTTQAGYQLTSAMQAQMDAINNRYGMRTKGGKKTKPDGKQKKAA